MSADDSLTNKYGIDLTRIPQHIAIIMDGNGRWAKKRLMPRNFGHRQGQKQLKKTLINCVKLGVKYLSVYVFSTENWRRPEEEVSFLLKFLKSTIQDELNELIKEGVRLKFLGDLSQFDQSLLDIISDSESKTNDNTNIQLNVMLNYGGRREIIDAIKTYVKNGGDIDSLTEDNLQPCLYTEGIPDPDILIRTGGDLRISNFMLWQAAYSEFFFWTFFGQSLILRNLSRLLVSFNLEIVGLEV